MTTAIAERPTSAEIMERVIVVGDLSKLQPEERALYYRSVCESMGLNPLSRPFEYITLNSKLTLYARKDATDQLRQLRGVSLVGKPDIQIQDGLCIVTVMVKDAAGRTDSDTGIVAVDNLKGEAKANAVMKAITKAKRRATLSICGLGWLDETEVETIPGARVESSGVVVDQHGTVLEDAPAQEPKPTKKQPSLVERWTELATDAKACGLAVPPMPEDREALIASGTQLGQSLTFAHKAGLTNLVADLEAAGIAMDASDRIDLGQDQQWYVEANEYWRKRIADAAEREPKPF